MTGRLPDPHFAHAHPTAHGAWRLRALGRKARKQQLSGHALMAVGLALAVLAAAVLLWAGIVSGAPRAILLLIAAGLLPLRLLINRMGAMTLADGVSKPSANSALRRWLSHWEGAALLLAAGFCAYGSKQNAGPAVGLLAGALLLIAALRGRGRRAARLSGRLYPTMLLGGVSAAAAFEPLWGWRGQTLVIGLCAISAVLIVQVLRVARRAAD